MTPTAVGPYFTNQPPATNYQTRNTSVIQLHIEYNPADDYHLWVHVVDFW